MTILCTIDLLTREVSLPGDQCIAAYDHNVDVVHFQSEPVDGFDFDTSTIRIAAQGPNNVRHDYAVDPSTVSIEEETGYITFDWPIPQGVTEMPIGAFKYGDKGNLIFSVCAEIIDGSTVSQAWHSDDGIITVVAHLEPEAGGGEDPEEEATNAQKIGQLQTDVAVIRTAVGALGNGSPAPVATVAEMTDESAVYLYTGSETGYTAGNWYYYNGTAWTSGGTYGGAVTDTTLSISGRPADAKAVGDAIAGVNGRLTQEALLSYGILINSAERWTPFESDCDNLSPNRIYIITYSADVANVPYTNFGGYLFTFTGAANVNSTGVQIAVRPTTTEVWKRVKWGGTWGAWTNLFDSVNSALSTHTSQISALQTAGLNDIEAYGLLISNADRWTPFESDCNNLPVNRIVVSTYNTGVSNLPFTGFNGFFFTFVPAYNTTSVKCQIAIRPTTQDMYIRTLWGGNWSAWTKMAFATDVSSMQSSVDNLYYTNDIWKVFHKVGIIGDSLASGESASNEGGSTVYHDLYQFSWGQCMARDSGNTYYNFSKGGLTTRTWLTDANYGYALASQSDKLCDAYIIGLGQNDAGQKMTVGSTADIDFSNPDNNADTFYGNYAKIIQKMRVLAPKAPIFVMTRPTVPASNAYETAIRTMPTLFDNVYLLDMYKHVNAYYDANSIIRRCLRSGHYNAVGYQVMSKHIEEEISNVIKDNLDDFLQVEFINTDWSWT